MASGSFIANVLVSFFMLFYALIFLLKITSINSVFRLIYFIIFLLLFYDNHSPRNRIVPQVT